MTSTYSLFREIIALLLNNLKETKLKIYKSVFVGAVVSSELFKHKGKPLLIRVLYKKENKVLVMVLLSGLCV